MENILYGLWKGITLILGFLSVLGFMSSSPFMLIAPIFWGAICNHTAKHKKGADVDFSFIFGACYGLFAWVWYLAKEDVK